MALPEYELSHTRLRKENDMLRDVVESQVSLMSKVAFGVMDGPVDPIPGVNILALQLSFREESVCQ